jgi:hypothetical protein
MLVSSAFTFSQRAGHRGDAVNEPGAAICGKDASGADADMTIESKRQPHQNDRDRDERERLRQEKIEHERIHQEKIERERLRQEEALDEALKNTFPASDPVSVEQP